MKRSIAARSLVLVATLLISGCAVISKPSASVFTPITEYGFSEEVYATSVFLDTTDTEALAEKYGPEWEMILNKIREYEELLESR